FDAAPPVMSASSGDTGSEIAMEAAAPKVSPAAPVPSAKPSFEAPVAEVAKPVPALPIEIARGLPSAHGAAAAPAPAREATSIEIKPSLQPLAHEASTPSFTMGSTPSFGALEKEDSADSGGNKKILIAAAVLLVAAALGYFGWTKMGQSNAPATTS